MDNHFVLNHNTKHSLHKLHFYKYKSIHLSCSHKYESYSPKIFSSILLWPHYKEHILLGKDIMFEDLKSDYMNHKKLHNDHQGIWSKYHSLQGSSKEEYSKHKIHLDNGIQLSMSKKTSIHIETPYKCHHSIWTVSYQSKW